MRARLVVVFVLTAVVAGLLPAGVSAQERRPTLPEVFEAGEANRVPVGGPARPQPPRRPERGAEAVELRSERSRSFRQSDGSIATEVSQSREHFRDAGGGWAPIDSRLLPRGGGFANASNDVAVMLPRSLGEGAVEVQHEGRSVAFVLEGAAGGPAAVDGATATYAGALPGVDARVTATPEGVKEDLVLAGPTATRTFAYAVTTAGLTPQLRGDGSVVLLDVDGAEAMTVPAAWAEDAAGARTPRAISPPPWRPPSRAGR